MGWGRNGCLAGAVGTASIGEEGREAIMHIFDADDVPYQAWMQQNSAGFVLNTGRASTSPIAVYHKSDCHHITSYGPRQPEGCFTRQDRIKICSTDRDVLLRWRVQKRPYAQGQERDCQTCNPGCISGARDEGGLDERKREQLTPYVRGAGR